MSVLVDTPIWSLALRRKPSNLNSREQRWTKALAELIRAGEAQLVGVVRQELLSGIREEQQFRRLRGLLSAFEDPQLEASDYEEAAHFHNQCRTQGVAGSAFDFLLCAVAHRRGWQIFTSDLDFGRYAKIVGAQLYTPK
ncbi:MAG: PIN domain-containing protein [Terriglobales bacterium]|jgi:predicted nucleic acid-binding protein